ncbi:hypothetical protein CC80DRAFT_160463 [Byssothecium circinans]|uniref:Isomerase YbhE n=1 Tax=Byssothecium circinans TaxID=147558 RepID=A0A6A5UB59_9PLEO|nr:hypothetical protein CC80DRAFT_160463 [Byssothecium circinans]
MHNLLHLVSIAGYATAALHHLYVGENEGNFIHVLELDDAARTPYEMGMVPAGASPSLALDHSKKYLFGSRAQDGMLTRYAVQSDYSLKTEGTAKIPASCNTTKFSSIHVTSSPLAPFSIFGSASTGTCSTLFSSSLIGFRLLRSKDIAGDVRSLAWSPNGRHLHALDSRSSSSPATSIFNFYISEDANLNDQNGTDILANVTGASEMVTHPTANIVYVVLKDTNELVTIPLEEHKGAGDATSTPKRFNILPSTIDATQFTTIALTISSSKTSLWTLSQSSVQAIISVFSLDPKTGEVITSVARAAWTGAGGLGHAHLAPAPFTGGDLIAVTNSPIGIVAFLGLDVSAKAMGKGEQDVVNVDGDGFLEEIWTLGTKDQKAGVDGGADVLAVKLKSYGRIDLGMDALGEGVWVD